MKLRRTYGQSTCVTAMEVESFSKEIVVFEATTMYVEKYGRQGLERRWCAKESPKVLPIDTLWL